MYKLIAINTLVLLGLLLLLNIISYGIIQWTENKSYTDISKVLPNFKGKEKAFIDFRNERRSCDLVYTPFTGWKGQEIKGKYLNIDENGVRKTIHTSTPKKLTYWFLGGSVMWGAFNSDSTTIPSLLSLQTDTIEVHNYGERGFNSQQCLAKLNNLYTLGEQADVVFSLDGINEIHDLCNLNSEKIVHSHSETFRNYIDIQTKSGIKPTLQNLQQVFTQLFLANTNELILKARQKYIGLRSLAKTDEYICDTDSTSTHYLASQLIRNWEIMNSIVTAQGGTFIAILQPTLTTSKAKREHILNRGTPQKEKQIQTVYPIIQQIIKEKNHDWIYDLTEVFDEYSDEYIYTDICHVSPNGNEYLTNAIINILEEMK